MASIASSPRLLPGIHHEDRGARGFTPLMAAYERAELDGVLSLDDEEVIWLCPEDG